MVPGPVAEFVAKSMVWVRRIVKCPEAPANRPVPPTIVALLVTLDTFGGTNSFSAPTVVVHSWSPFAAVKLNVPVAGALWRLNTVGGTLPARAAVYR